MTHSLETHIVSQIETILRPPQGILKHPFFVPGGIFHDELWDWDSMWIAKGICGLQHGMEATLWATFTEHACGSWKNFLENQAANGGIPIMVKGGHPDCFGCTLDSGIECNQAKPVFGQFALDIARVTGDFQWIAPYFDGLLRFYARWTSRYRSQCGLLVWGSDVAVGVDNDPTTYGRPEFSSANLLLNSLYYRDLLAAIEIAEALHRPADAAQLGKEADLVKAAMQKECLA